VTKTCYLVGAQGEVLFIKRHPAHLLISVFWSMPRKRVFAPLPQFYFFYFAPCIRSSKFLLIKLSPAPSLRVFFAVQPRHLRLFYRRWIMAKKIRMAHISHYIIQMIHFKCFLINISNTYVNNAAIVYTLNQENKSQDPASYKW
jgi:hypothetical protein